MNIVIIPVYKDRLDPMEFTSLSQCLKILGKYSICLIGPKSLDLTIYKQLFSSYGCPLCIEYFDSEYFSSVTGYNKLLLSKSFYERFAKWKYMLIYQLDAYVFKDELDYWCSKGYDYIGAPWLKLNGSLDYKNSGNGGFSLRKIDTFISLFSHKGKLLTLRGLNCYYRYRGPIHKIRYIWEGLFEKNNSLVKFTEIDPVNEDLFYAALKYKRGQRFAIPSSSEAMFFSFEERPDLLFEKTNHTLPFGCHAWYKNEYNDFWKQYIHLTDL